MRSLRSISIILILFVALLIARTRSSTGQSQDRCATSPNFYSMDCNGDRKVNISDAVCLLTWLSLDSDRPPEICLAQEAGGGLTPDQVEILSHMSIVYLDDGHGKKL